jgi:hypothetical protein
MLNSWDHNSKVIIDSGAFTAFTAGKPINPKDYVTWALDFQSRWKPKLKELYFMNLDVIGDQEASWKNQSLIESLGLEVLPIITYGADSKHLIKAITHYPYIALGGLVPYARQKNKLKKWLDYCFSILVDYKNKTGIMPKVHLLGITTEDMLNRYPCYSSDSSTWVQSLRFGETKHLSRMRKVPLSSASNDAESVNLYVLKQEILRLMKMETDATNLWKSRGIIFDD